MWRCDGSKCQLEFLWPQPSSDELSELYQATYYRPGVRNEENVYGNTPDAVVQHLACNLITQTGPLNGQRLLDFGAGIGRFALHARSLGAAVECVEPSEEARRLLVRQGLPCYPDLETLLQTDRTPRFNVITAIEVAEHLLDPVATFRQLSGLLVDGGRLFLTTPNFASLRAWLQQDGWEQYRNPTHLFFFTPTSLHNALTVAGLATVSRLPTRVEYPAHGLVRRWVQKALQRTGLDGDLAMVATCVRPVPPARA